MARVPDVVVAVLAELTEPESFLDGDNPFVLRGDRRRS
jgi:hypothetical protein